jgi:hypothetical protein
VDKYVNELSGVTIDFMKACGRMLEQEHLRFIAMFSATRSSGGCGRGFHKSVMDHKVIMNSKAVNGDEPIFRHWHQKFTTPLGQFGDISPVSQRNLFGQRDGQIRNRINRRVGR